MRAAALPTASRPNGAAARVDDAGGGPEEDGEAPARRAAAGAVARRLSGIAAAVLVSLAVGAPAISAQTASDLGSDGFREQEDDPDLGWRGSADLGFTLTDGNSETTSLSLGGELDYRLARQRWAFNGSYVRASTDGEETANKGDAELMYEYFPGPRFFFFGKAGAGFNAPAGLDLRLAPGAGVGYRVVDRERLTVSVETGGEWTRDEFEDGTSDEAVRLSAAESASWDLSETTSVVQAVTYRPEAAQLDDFLLDGRISVTTRIVEGLGLKVTFRDQYDSEPFVDPDTGEQRAKNDITFVTGLTYQF